MTVPVLSPLLLASLHRAAHYRALRRSRPDLPASTIVHYMRAAGPESLDQWACSHDWSSGYADDGEFEREVATYCHRCGLCGDI